MVFFIFYKHIFLKKTNKKKYMKIIDNLVHYVKKLIFKNIGCYGWLIAIFNEFQTEKYDKVLDFFLCGLFWQMTPIQSKLHVSHLYS